MWGYLDVSLNYFEFLVCIIMVNMSWLDEDATDHDENENYNPLSAFSPYCTEWFCFVRNYPEIDPLYSVRLQK